MNRDETVLKYLTKVSKDLSTHKFNLNGRKNDVQYIGEVVEIITEIQALITRLRKLVWKRRGRGKAVISTYGK